MLVVVSLIIPSSIFPVSSSGISSATWTLIFSVMVTSLVAGAAVVATTAITRGGEAQMLSVVSIKRNRRRGSGI